MAERDRWRVKPGDKVDLGGIDPGSTKGAPGKSEAIGALPGFNQRLYGLQERLWAEHRRSVLVVIQAIDAGGKDGTVRHVFRGLNPTGVRVVSFRVPTDEDLDHDFLWRVHRQTPARGEVVVFNRSHYEDVLVVRVHDLVPKAVWQARYRYITDFEDNLAAAGTTVVKLFLHISPQEQAERLQSRVDDPTKHWKFRAADLAERVHWDSYRSAFEDAITRTSTERAPWYVIPADHKWYRNWAVSTVLIETLDGLDPQYPPGDNVAGVVIT